MGAVARVLVVEDERVLAAALAEGLNAEGFAVEVAFDGVRGYELAASGDFDVVVLDLMLPGVNGYRLCAQLRASSSVPVLVLTAKQGEFDEMEALDTGADDFLTKPFSFAVLVARLRALLRRARAQHVAIMRVGDLVIDSHQRRCTRGGVDIDLTPREFALLERLAREAGRTITKRALLDDVWDFAFDDESNIVEVYVGYLRRKVDRPFGTHTIHTVRGVGYRMEPADA